MSSLRRSFAGVPRVNSPLYAALSALLLAMVGFFVAGITGGLATFYLLALGFWPCAPIGFACGAWLGWRTPLRDSTIIFVCYSAILILAYRQGLSSTGQEQFWDLLLWGTVAGPGGIVLPRLPLRFLPVASRRTAAIVLAALWIFAAGIAVYRWLWLEP